LIKVVNSDSFYWALSVVTVHIYLLHVWPFAFMLQMTWIKAFIVRIRRSLESRLRSHTLYSGSSLRARAAIGN